MSRDIVTVEFYSTLDPEKLLGAVDLPRKRMLEGAEQVGRAICRATAADSVNAILIDENGNAVERMLISKR